jgi:hypothetical protein
MASTLGRRISIETLEGQILAIDASIWLTVLEGHVRDPETGRSASGHTLAGDLFDVLSSALSRNRPVFVFDAPEIKATGDCSRGGKKRETVCPTR